MQTPPGEAPGSGELDPATLAGFARAVGHDGARQLLETLLADLPERLSEFQRGLRTGDLSLVRHSMHKLKAGAAYVGASRFSHLCETLERCAKAGDAAGLSAQEAILAARVRQLERELRTYLRGDLA